MKLRAYEPADAPAVVGVWNDAMPDRFPLDCARFGRTLRRACTIAKAMRMVAIEDGRIVGYGSSRIVSGAARDVGIAAREGCIKPAGRTA